VVQERNDVQSALEVQKAQREAQELLRQQEKLLRDAEKLAIAGRMAATLAHEVNNPLEAITNFLYLMRSDQGMSTQSRMFLEKAEDELKRVAHITRQTLSFHKGSVKETDFDLPSMCEEVISLIRPRMESKRLQVQKCFASKSKVTAIESEARQVISNLILNATQAAPPDSVITVMVDAPEAGMVRFAVEDLGSGIPEENESRIFKPFFTTKELGTGLGLWVSQDLLRQNGGDLKLENGKNPTRFGAYFRVGSAAASTTTGQ
jgi:signal transduction histidine kinase